MRIFCAEHAFAQQVKSCPEYNSYCDIECIIHWEMQYVIVIYLVFRLVTFEVVHSNSSTCMGNASNTSEKKSTVILNIFFHVLITQDIFKTMIMSFKSYLFKKKI